jgi:uncharacterized CHY-type Zn-finger protein
MRVRKSLSEKTHVANTLIVNCPHCNGLLLAPEDQKTRTCPYCGNRINLHRANKMASAENVFEASQILRELKSKRQTNINKPKPEK